MPFTPATSDEAVKKATGKIWNEWFKILDKEKAYQLNHTEMARFVNTKLKVKPWWSQMVANTYEQYKGLRKKYSTTQGYQVGASKTILKPVSVLFKQWKSMKLPVIVTTERENKIIRGKVTKDDSRFDVAFTAKSADKTQVAVQQTKLKNPAAVKQAKLYWSKILDELSK